MLDQQMLISLLSLFLLHGSTDTGTRNVTAEHLQFFRRSLMHSANYMARVLTHGGTYGAGLFSTLLHLNFDVPTGFRMPWLEFRGVEEVDLKEQAEIMVLLSQAGVLGPVDDDLLNFARDQYSLPPINRDEELEEEPEEEIEETEEEPEGPTKEEVEEAGEDDVELARKKPQRRIPVRGRDDRVWMTHRELRPGEEVVAFATIADELDDAGDGLKDRLWPVMREHRDAVRSAAKDRLQRNGLENIDEFIDDVRPEMRKRYFGGYEQAFADHYKGMTDLGEREGAAEAKEIFGRKKGIGKTSVSERAAEGAYESNTGKQIAKAWSRKNAEDVFGRWSSYLEDLSISAAQTGDISRLRDVKWEDSTFHGYGISGTTQIFEATRQAILENTGRDLDKPMMAHYTALLDEDVCEQCEKTDNDLIGGVVVGSEAYHENRPPNPRCLGGGGRFCRCIYVYRVEG